MFHMDIDVDEIPVFLRGYKNKPITKNIRFLTKQQFELIETVKQIPNYERRFVLPLHVIKQQQYAIIEEKGENIISFLERNEKQRDNLIISIFQFLSESCQLLPFVKWNVENIIVYNGRTLLDISSVTEEGLSINELYEEIKLYFSNDDDVLPSS
jgi:hypothetical protein